MTQSTPIVRNVKLVVRETVGDGINGRICYRGELIDSVSGEFLDCTGWSYFTVQDAELAGRKRAAEYAGSRVSRPELANIVGMEFVECSPEKRAAIDACNRYDAECAASGRELVSAAARNAIRFACVVGAGYVESEQNA